MKSAAETSLRVLLAASEALPFSKTGGLADVVPALARALSARGHEVSLFVPMHRQALTRDVPEIHDAGMAFEVPVGPDLVEARIQWAELPDSGVRVFLIDQPDYFDRPGLYGEAGADYLDNCARFVFFSRAILEAARVLNPQER